MKNIWNKYKREFVVLLATLVMAVVFTVLNSNFLNYNNFVTILQQMVLNGVLAVGMMFTIITGGIDLSVGCTYAITGIIVASCTVNYGMNPFLGILVGLEFIQRSCLRSNRWCTCNKRSGLIQKHLQRRISWRNQILHYSYGSCIRSSTHSFIKDEKW